jgi:hypothetical protein
MSETDFSYGVDDISIMDGVEEGKSVCMVFVCMYVFVCGVCA